MQEEREVKVAFELLPENVPNPLAQLQAVPASRSAMVVLDLGMAGG